MMNWIINGLITALPFMVIASVLALCYFTYEDRVAAPRRDRERRRAREQREQVERLERKAAEARAREEEVRRQYGNAQATLDILNMMGASAHDARVELIREAYKAGQRGD